MRIRKIATGFCVALLAVALAAPAFAGPRSRGSGGGKGVQQQLRDGTCCPNGGPIRDRDRDQLRDGSGDLQQKRLRDRTRIQSPAPAK